jgi:ABC-type transporter Mla maintaining outer membrane lipid asymmetry permease subunit MlaE
VLFDLREATPRAHEILFELQRIFEFNGRLNVVVLGQQLLAALIMILGALFSGYLFAFLNDVPLRPSDYFQQLALALTWEDFILLALKTGCFGIIIGIVSSYQGLARALRLEEVSSVTTRAVVNSVVACVLLDALFIVVYLVM